MFSKYTRDLRWLTSGLAMLALTVIWLGANAFTTQGQSAVSILISASLRTITRETAEPI